MEHDGEPETEPGPERVPASDDAPKGPSEGTNCTK